MKIYFNNHPIEIEEATNLATLIKEHTNSMLGFAVAVNNNIISKKMLEDIVLVPNDKVVLIKAVCGG